MSGDEFMERFSWHVADKGFRMVRYCHENTRSW
ncbi:transposase [Escherichia coli]